MLNSKTLPGSYLSELEKSQQLPHCVLCGLSSWSLPCKSGKDHWTYTIQDRLLELVLLMNRPCILLGNKGIETLVLAPWHCKQVWNVKTFQIKFEEEERGGRKGGGKGGRGNRRNFKKNEMVLVSLMSL